MAKQCVVTSLELGENLDSHVSFELFQAFIGVFVGAERPEVTYNAHQLISISDEQGLRITFLKNDAQVTLENIIAEQAVKISLKTQEHSTSYLVNYYGEYISLRPTHFTKLSSYNEHTLSPQIFAEVQKLHVGNEKQLKKTYIVIHKGHSHAFSFERGFRLQPNKRDLLVASDDEIKKTNPEGRTKRVKRSKRSGNQHSALSSHSLFTQKQCANTQDQGPNIQTEDLSKLTMRSSQEENTTWHLNTPKRTSVICA